MAECQWPEMGSATDITTEPALLVLLHASPFRARAGGTENHVIDRVTHLKLKRVVLVYPSDPQHVTAALIVNGDLSFVTYHTYKLQSSLTWYAFANPEAEDVVLWIARFFNATAVAIEHLYRWPLSLPRVLKNAGLPYTYATHDFFAVCPNLNLVNASTLKLCGTHYGGTDESEACLGKHFNSFQTQPPCELKNVVARHQTVFAEILRDAAALFFPSESARTRVLENVRVSAEKSHVIPHGYDAPPCSPHTADPAVLRVAMMGMLACLLYTSPSPRD